jgi:flavin-dependent dehydrogenase
MFDVALAGGGPVGLMTALYAAQAGLSVRVYEPRQGEVDKACGEGLMPGALAALREFEISPIGQPLRGIRYVAGPHHAEAVFRDGTGCGVRRTTLHRALLDTVDAEGIEVLPRPVDGFVQQDECVVFGGERTRYLIAADGLHSSIRRRLGLARKVASARRYGLRAHVQMPPWTDFVEVVWSRETEAYLTPVEPNLVNIALLSSRRRPFAEQLRRFPQLYERIGACPVTAVRGAGPLHQRTARRVSGRVMLVGDASGYIDALTGEGMAVGFAQARAAVAAIQAGRPQLYERSWHRITWRHRLLTWALVSATRSSVVRRSLVPAAQRLPAVFSAAVHELARHHDLM